MGLKVGDRVVLVGDTAGGDEDVLQKGTLGTVCKVCKGFGFNYGVEWDIHFPGGHDCDGLSAVFSKIYQTIGSGNLHGHDILINGTLLTADQEAMWMGRIDKIVDDGATIHISFVERPEVLQQ